MKIIFNLTDKPVTSKMFKAGVVDIPAFLKEELHTIGKSVDEGKNTITNGTRLTLGLLKDSAPEGTQVGIILPDSIQYSEWKMITTAAAKVGVDVIIDSEL